jgi:hypothetical protein
MRRLVIRILNEMYRSFAQGFLITDPLAYGAYLQDAAEQRGRLQAAESPNWPQTKHGWEPRRLRDERGGAIGIDRPATRHV